jgi:protein TonB
MSRIFCYRFVGAKAVVRLLGMLLSCVIAACTITAPPAVRETLGIGIKRPDTVTAESYKERVARHITQANAQLISSGHPQAMLRSVVVVAFEVDRTGRVRHASVYRTNGDDDVERTALATLRRASPLPAPPAALLTHAGEADLMEGWLFNDDGRFQLRSIAETQRQDDD